MSAVFVVYEKTTCVFFLNDLEPKHEKRVLSVLYMMSSANYKKTQVREFH